MDEARTFYRMLQYTANGRRMTPLYLYPTEGEWERAARDPHLRQPHLAGWISRLTFDALMQRFDAGQAGAHFLLQAGA